jgi:hypothetical protein
MKNKKNHPLADKLNELLDQLQTVLETEPEFDSPFRRQLGEIAINHPGFKELRHEADISQPSYKEKTLSISGAMYKMIDKDLIDYVYSCDTVSSYLAENEPEYGTPAHQDWLDAIKAIGKLAENGKGELFSRSQLYRSDLADVEQTTVS